MTPMSIIPYPATTTQIGAQPGAGQTPRRATWPGVFELSTPMTSVSVPRSQEGIWDRRGEPRGRSDLKLERAQERYRVCGT